MAKLCITIACKVAQEKEVEPGVSQYVHVERCFNFYILSYRKFYTQSDLDHWIDFAQGYLKETYGAINLRVSSVSELTNLFSARGVEYVKVLDFEYAMKSYDID